MVLVAVDQLRPDYFARFGSQFTGGLAFVRAHSAFFPRALQDHANTETAPGHSTMLSGREPTHTGVVSNDRGVPDAAAPLVDFPGPGASPQRFDGTTLFDWMLAADPRSRVLSVSRKDRGAILPIGRAKGSVYWWANGAFTTSRYYADTLPTWVRAFNGRHSAEALAGATWNLLLPAAAYPEPDSMFFEHTGDDIAFPHALPKTPEQMRAQLANFPWMDSVTLAFALEGVRTLGLGQAGSTDLLSVSLSTTDAVGHAYGPDSREIHDQMLRLDRWLGQFLDSLARHVSAERTVFVLASDHGVTSFPEFSVVVEHRKAGRTSLDGLAREEGNAFAARYAVDFGFDFNSGLLGADTAALRARGVNIDSLARHLAREALAHPGVAAVYTPRTLASAAASDTNALRWRHAIPATVPWLICAVAKPGYIWSTGRQIAEHGTLNEDDVTVPIAFWGRDVVAGTSQQRIRTVDIAPTLAAYLGLTPSEPLDGRRLAGVFRRVATDRMRARR